MIERTISIGTMELRGRIVMPPMGTYQSDEAGYVTEKLLDYYRLRAKNPKVSMIVVEHAFVDPRGRSRAKQLSIAEDGAIPGLTRLVDEIHGQGTAVMAQLNFGGSAAPRSACLGEPLAPSAVVHPNAPATGDPIPPREISMAEIDQLVEAFAAAALRAKKAGFDGVEIHSAHGYFLNQFYSPLTNLRTDDYGGSLENRLLLHCRIIRAVRETVGDEYPVSVRLGGYDDREGGNGLLEAVKAADLLAKESIQMLSLSGGMCGYVRKGHNEPGWFADMAVAVRKETELPVLLTGGIRTLEDANNLLQEQICDLVGVGRPILRDAEWTG